MKVKIFLISLIVILLAGIGVFVGLEWDDVIVPLFTGEEIYTKKDISDIEKKYENALDNSINRQLEEIEKEKEKSYNLEYQLREQQRDYRELLTLYSELMNNQMSELTQEMFNILVNYGSIYHINNNEIFVSGINDYEPETIYYNILTKECHKIDGIGQVINYWFRNDNMLYGISQSYSSLVRVNIETFESKTLKQDFLMRNMEDVIRGTNSAGKDCLLFYGFDRNQGTDELVELELETENVQTFGEELLNIDDVTLEFHLLWEPDNQFLKNNSDVYRYNLGKFEKCFTLKYLANLYVINKYMYERNLEEYCFDNVLAADDGINNIQFINLENFKTLELSIDKSGQYVLFNNQFTKDVIYIGEVDGKLYKINVPEMTSEELGTIKGIIDVSKNDVINGLFGRLFFIQNDDLSYSLKLARYGSEELENVKDFTSDTQLNSIDSYYNSVRIQVQENGQQKVYVYDCITGEISEEI